MVPSSGACVFSPPTVTLNASIATTTLTISGAQALAPNFIFKDGGVRRAPPLYAFWIFVELASMLLLLRGNNYGLVGLKRLSLPGALLLTTLIMAGCGSSSSTPQAPVSQNYQITVTASAPASGSGTSASQSQTQTVSLTVQ
jgi:hypothetical protein